MSLGLRGETIISQWIHPSMPPSCPGAPWATPNARTLQPSLGWNPAARPLSPPWSLRGAAGSDSSYRASIQSEIKPWWENTDLDGQTDRWMEGQWCRYMETWRTGRSRPSGGGDIYRDRRMNRLWKSVTGQWNLPKLDQTPWILLEDPSPSFWALKSVSVLWEGDMWKRRLAHTAAAVSANTQTHTRGLLCCNQNTQ